MAEEAVLRLASELAASLAKSWKEGNPRPAQEFLAEHAHLQDHPDAILRVIYEEICVQPIDAQPRVVANLRERFPNLQAEILALWECHRMVHAEPEPISYPAPGEFLGDFCILSELGEGANGRVYLADQPYLAGRSVVLKVTPCKGSEHFNLARLQHSHIVPLLWVQEIEERSLRILCMPYLGGTTLEEVLRRLREIPLSKRNGKDIIDSVAAIDEERDALATHGGGGRLFLGKANFPDALCWIGVCLADALHYAHEQGLVHFDVRPSNVLISSDGRPMLLDFHLARHPVAPSSDAPQWIGGTPRYMSPEQHAAWIAIRDNQPITQAVDARSDLYSLAAMLVECFSDQPMDQIADKTPLELLADLRQIPAGFREILRRCLSPNPQARYPSAAALAGDLRRQLNHLPLVGVGNGNLIERWRKWRSRRPHALFGLSSIAVVLGLAAIAFVIQWRHWETRWEAARTLLSAGQEQIDSGRFSDAVSTLRRGIEQVQGVPFQGDLLEEFNQSLRHAREANNLARVHLLVEQFRFLHANESPPEQWMLGLAESAADCWQRRREMLESAGAILSSDEREEARRDFLELAISLSELLRREKQAQSLSHIDADRILDEAEQSLGSSLALEFAEAVGPDPVRGAKTRRELIDQLVIEGSAFDCSIVGRHLLRQGRLEDANLLLDRATRLKPDDFWSWFWKGVCGYRRADYAGAKEAWTVAIALRPNVAECFYSRGLAHLANANWDESILDFDQALALEPNLAKAMFNRGVVRLNQKEFRSAETDLLESMKLGADPARAHFNLALVYWGQNDLERSEIQVTLALKARPDFPEAVEFQKKLAEPRSRTSQTAP